MIHMLMTAVCLGGVYTTNLELVETTVVQACEDLVEILEQEGIDTVTIEVEGDHGGNWLVSQTAGAVLSGSGVTVISGRESSSPAVLRIRPMDLAVRYGDTSRSWLFGRKRVERHAVCELSATLLDPGGTILVSVRTSASETDLVPVAELDVLDQGDYTWLGQGEIGEEGGGILEPLVVTGVVASLIYLFYSSRAE